MEQVVKRSAWPSGRTIILALLAGFVVFVLLFRGSGTAAIPPTCYSLLSYVVPCEPWVAWAAGAATAVGVGAVLWMNERRRR